MTLRFGTRLFLVCLLLVGLGLVVFLNSAREQIRPAIRQASEEALVDTANLLAEVAALQFNQGFGQDTPFALAVRRYRQRQLNARIWSLHKTRPDFAVYVTDSLGRVRYHTDGSQVGLDYSGWRDVSRTLAGEYGARTTRSDPKDDWSSTMYVAAPIYRGGDIIGSLTVSQPVASMQPFLHAAHDRLWRDAAVILFVALILGAGLSSWMAGSVRKLERYVQALRAGKKVSRPQLHERELNRLALATESMHEEIQGKDYVENYIHTLAHEMKSPLSAIRGASEVLEDMVAGDEGQRFLGNIDQESLRLQRLIDRLLSLAAVEKKQSLQHIEELELWPLIENELGGKMVALESRNLSVLCRGADSRLRVQGDRFLLQQALSNLLDNAIEFSPPGAELEVELARKGRAIMVAIRNTGEPIPAYAMTQIFDRFYSLPRPSGGRKSTGLGLSFVREVALLHRGRISLLNRDRPTEGVEARLELPAGAWL